MGNISSINFQKSYKNFNYIHNSREQKIEPHYFLKSADRLDNYYSCSASEAQKIFDENFEERREKSYKKGLIKKDNCKYSAVLNLKASSTVEDVKKVAQFFEEKYDFKVCQIAIHKDEGHYSESGEALHNFHAHLEFLTLSKEGKNNWRLINRSELRKIQGEVAKIMGMKRGKDKRETKKERLEARQYRQEMKEKTLLKRSIEDIKSKYHSKEPEIPQISKIGDKAKENYQNRLKSLKTQKLTLKDKIFSKDVETRLQRLEAGMGAYKTAAQEFQTLAKDAIIDRERIKKDFLEVKDENGKLKKENQTLTSINKGLEADIKTLKERITEIENEYKKAREALKNSGIATQEDYQKLKKEKEEKIKAANAPASMEESTPTTPQNQPRNSFKPRN